MQQTQTVERRVANLDCEHDAAALKRGMAQAAGIIDIEVYPKSAKVRLRYDPEAVSDSELMRKLEEIGYPAQAGREPPSLPKPWRNIKVITSVASGLLLLAGWLGPSVLSLPLYLSAIVIGGYFFGREALQDLIFERKIGIELLMSIAAIVAAALGQAAEGAMLVFLYSISEAAEGYTEEKTRSAVRALMALAPKVALVRRDNVEFETPVEDLAVGDIFIVRSGESIATDGEVISGASGVNQAPVTGESVPVEKAPGDKVFAASINGEGALEVRATRTFADNTLARIIQLVEEAQERRGKSQRFIERFGLRYSPVILAIGVLIALSMPVLFDASWRDAIMRATVFIVAAAPCALVISIPITMVASLGAAARNGVLVKGGVFLEELGKVKVVALDKTGTLTRGAPEVMDIILGGASSSRPASEEALLGVAAGVERRSEHPLARAIINKADANGVKIPDVTDAKALTGAGIKAQINGRTVYVGSPSLFSDELGQDLGELANHIPRLQSEGKTVVIVGDDEAPWGLLALRDSLRAGIRGAIDGLHDAGIERVVMLTGDNSRAAHVIASEAGIDEVYADLKPEDKVFKVRELMRASGHVAMVGDGVNDAPALAEATVGVAMGAAGTDVALETADVALMADDLKKLVYALRLARRTQSVVRQNLGLSAIVIGALIVGAVSGIFTLPTVVVAHELSEFIVIASGLRMLRG
ncbi:Lead, cadmium, zinc and mercury transporting ATPase; Copper-translocating P-type ATPase [hydrothermal vent metagenome]|uniref:Lead, cadmium, zinc and mercury transporting ATPase Copper-translocating P-type ATPase n=1 Tax=hydrothermal vent metagenome TaxID=652676 RepID=A0A3B0T1H0_9ZZZZ